uniref:ZP domain-containing protein n=1 Tax=Rhabditophanes sp. KR3021 TaxID=114890 RepID=A0AC35U7P9_9BILA
MTQNNFNFELFGTFMNTTCHTSENNTIASVIEIKKNKLRDPKKDDFDPDYQHILNETSIVDDVTSKPKEIHETESSLTTAISSTENNIQKTTEAHQTESSLSGMTDIPTTESSLSGMTDIPTTDSSLSGVTDISTDSSITTNAPTTEIYLTETTDPHQTESSLGGKTLLSENLTTAQTQQSVILTEKVITMLTTKTTPQITTPTLIPKRDLITEQQQTNSDKITSTKIEKLTSTKMKKLTSTEVDIKTTPSPSISKSVIVETHHQLDKNETKLEDPIGTNAIQMPHILEESDDITKLTPSDLHVRVICFSAGANVTFKVNNMTKYSGAVYAAERFSQCRLFVQDSNFFTLFIPRPSPNSPEPRIIADGSHNNANKLASVKLKIMRDEKTVEHVFIGEQLKAVLKTDINHKKIKVLDCNVTRVGGHDPTVKTVQLISEGCSTMPQIISDISLGQFGLEANFTAFRIDGSDQIDILCNVMLCTVDCAPAIPCKPKGRRLRHATKDMNYTEHFSHLDKGSLVQFTFITLVIFVANICTFDFANSCKPIYVRWPRVRLNVQPTSEGTFSFTSCKGACTNEENPMRQGISQQCSSFNHRVGPNQYSSHCQIFQKDKTQILDGYVEADDRYSFYWKYCVKSDRVCSGEYAFTFLSDRYMASSEITKKFDSSTLEECLAECLNENSYLCRSVSFNRTSGECGLSKQNQLSKPAMIKLNNNPNFRVDYYENNCFNISESFAFDYRCEENGIRVKVDSVLPYTGALYGLYDFFTCRVEPKEETKFEYLFEYPTVSKNCSDSLRFKGKEMILEVVLSTDGVEPLYFITPDDLTFQAKCPINPTMGLEDNGDISEFPDSISGHISFPSRNTIALTSKSRNVVDKDIPVSVQTKTHEILTTLPTLTTKVVTTPIVTATAASAPITTTKVTTTTQKVNPTTATVSIESTIPEGIDEDIVSTAPTTLELLTKRVEEQNKPTTNPPTTPNYNLEPQRNVTEYIKPKIETKVDISDMVKNAVLKDKVIFEIYHNSRPVEAVVVGSRITLSFTPTLAVPPSYMSITGCQVEPIGSLYDWEKEPLAIIKDGCQADHVGLVCPPQKTDYGVRVTVESFRYQTTAQVQYTCLIRICPFSECPTQTCNAVEGCPRTESPDSITNIFKTRAKRLLSIDQIRQAVAANPYLLEQLNLTNNTLSTPSSNHLNTVLQQQLVAIAGDHVVRKRLVVVNSEEELKYYVKTGDVPELGN